MVRLNDVFLELKKEKAPRRGNPVRNCPGAAFKGTG
jgi:hypothetical protein